MSTSSAPVEAPNLDLVRTRGDRTGRRRVYVGDILIGAVERIRTRNTASVRNRQCWRWRGVPTRAAFTLNRIGAPVPTDPAVFAPLPAEHESADPALLALVEHLRASGAEGVTPLYVGAHA